MGCNFRQASSSLWQAPEYGVAAAKITGVVSLDGTRPSPKPAEEARLCSSAQSHPGFARSRRRNRPAITKGSPDKGVPPATAQTLHDALADTANAAKRSENTASIGGSTVRSTKGLRRLIGSDVGLTCRVSSAF